MMLPSSSLNMILNGIAAPASEGSAGSPAVAIHRARKTFNPPAPPAAPESVGTQGPFIQDDKEIQINYSTIKSSLKHMFSVDESNMVIPEALLEADGGSFVCGGDGRVTG